MEKERLRNSLLSSVSHDLRTPLAVISGSADSLRSSARLSDPRDQELANAIAVEAERLSRQVRNLLDMTRLEAGAVELNCGWQSLEELIGSAVLRTEKMLAGHSVKTTLPPDLPLLQLDGVLMEQAFVNLLENAARHTPPGTHIEISARVQPQSVIVEVANDGPPLREGDEDRIFDKFYRPSASPSQGFGLGLTICRAILAAHGGEIRATNRRGGGVSFIMTLPKADAAPEVPLG